MANIDFHEENEYRVRSKNLGRHDGSIMERFLIEKNIVANRTQAAYVLVAVFVILVGILFVLIFPPTNRIPDYIYAPDGNKYTPKEYVELVGQRRDPFDVTNEQ